MFATDASASWAALAGARLALMLAVLAPAARAQVVRGAVVDEASGRAMPGVVVVLFDSTGKRLAGVLADDSGNYAIRIAAAGRYGLRAERIGFRADAPTPVSLRPGETIQIRLVTRPIPVVLSTVRVAGRSPCVARASDGRELSAVWEEARKALYATDLTQRQELFSARVSRYIRTLDPRTKRVITHEMKEATGVTRNPFVSLAAAQLSANGFIREVGGEIIFYGPDASVLLSDEFLGDHCFRLRSGDGNRSGLIGLEFEPVRGRDKPEIAGTLWIDRRSAELRDLEYTYFNLPNLPSTVQSEDFGGRIEFHRMPTGAWIVKRWVIRMPVLVDRGRFAERTDAGVPGIESSRGERVQVGAIREEGGEVLATTAQGIRRELATERATVRGVVFDSTRMAPLAGARVFLDGTQFSTPSSADGSFSLGGVPAGTYTVSVVHARFDSLGVRPPGEEVALRLGDSATVRLAGPSHATLLARSCAADNHAPGMAAVRGRVRDGATGDAVADAEVTVMWNRLETVGRRVTEQRRATRTDAGGQFVLCALPEGSRLTMRAAREQRRSTPTPVALPRDTMSVLDLVIGGPVAVAASEPAPPPAAPARRPPTATSSNPALQEAERRRRRGGGSYLTRSQIERRPASRLSDLLRTMPGVAVRPDENGELVVELRGGTRVSLEPASPAPSVRTDSGAPPPTPSPVTGQLTVRRCPAAFQIDGIRIENMKIDSDVQPQDVELIEVYSSAIVPVEFGARNFCGLVLIWTRAFAERPNPSTERDDGP